MARISGYAQAITSNYDNQVKKSEVHEVHTDLVNHSSGGNHDRF